MDALEELVKQIDQYPTLPDVAIRVERELANEDCGLDRIGAMIELDPALASRIMKLANSAIFGSAQPTDSVTTAILRLGTREVRNAVLTVAVMQALPALPAPYDLRSFWTLGLASGIVCRRLAKDLGYPNPEEAYLAGLVHLMGSAFLAVSFTPRFQRAVETAWADGVLVDGSIAEEFGCHASVVGARLLEEWNFPSSIVEAVRHQLTPDCAGDAEFLASLVFAADRICRDLDLDVEDPAHSQDAWITEIPDGLKTRIESSGYPDITFYLIELKDSLAMIEDFASSVFQKG